MVRSSSSPDRPSFLDSFWAAPLELQLFAAFSILVVGLEFFLVLIGPSTFREALLPYTGWSASMPYAFGMLLVIALIRTKNLRFRRTIVAILVVYMVYGVVGLASAPVRSTTNPYLVVSPLRPLWTLLIPILWILVLCNPRVGRYCADEEVERK